MSTYPNYPGSRPGPHAVTHGPGGTDPLSLSALGALEAANNLSDLADVPTARQNLGAQGYKTETGNFTGIIGVEHAATATCTVTDPTTRPDGTAIANGDKFTVRVSAGTATVGGAPYAITESVIVRAYDAGAWLTKVFYDGVAAPVSTAQQAAINAIKNGEGINWVVVDTTAGDAINNGVNLLSAYALAKTLTPNGAAKTATNRALVLIPPGKFTLTTTLLLDTQFVDIVGTTGNAKDVLITSAIATDNSGTITQTASDVRIVSVSIENTQNTNARNNNATDPAAYAPDSSLAGAYLENVILYASNLAWPTRLSTIYSGTYKAVSTTAARAFGYGSTCSGNFTDCSVGASGFSASGTCSGNFLRCSGGTASFAGSGTASGSFIDCSATDGSFGSAGTASGTFVRCTAGANSFGGDGVCSGSFDFCVGGSLSFGNTDFDPGTLTGTLRYCRLTSGDFQTVSGAGKTRLCLSGTNVENNQG